MSAILAAVESGARQRPAAVALQGDYLTVSYGDLAVQVRRCAGELRGRVLGLLLDNGPAWVIFDLAAQAAGLTCVPLPGFFSDAQIGHVIATAGIDCIVTDQPARLERVLDPREPWFFGALTVAGALFRIYRTGAPVAASVDGAARVSFTSGTTGTPKGVCLGSGAVERVAAALCAATGASPADRSLSLLPLSTLLENVAVYAALLAGACAGLPSLRKAGMGSAGIDVGALCRTLTQHAPSVVVLVPQLLRALVAAAGNGWRPPGNLRFLAVGGAPCDRGLLERAAALGLPVYEGYGLSEAASVVCLNLPGRRRPGSVGRPLPHVRLRISGDGEVLIAGNFFRGYVGEPVEAGEFWPTGDLGHVDEDGYLHLGGRKSEVIVTACGRNVSPEWVEGELRLHPAVAQAVVFGQGRPFLIALLAPARAERHRELAQAVDETNRRLPEYARVRGFHALRQPLAPGCAELTPDGRPRRSVIEARYGAVLEPLYQEDVHGVS